ncbi:group I truncated hemoglobin [Pseudomonas syringae]|uniref:group I truncated hemoglobin n=1 Tax=Pseudomonas syringae TaxID=317 RepID=UPI003F872666
MRRVLIVLMLTVLASCAQQPPRDDSLYQDLGQRAGIQRIVEGMLLNIAKDERIVEHFKKVNIVRLRDKLVEQLCVEAGGPCRYTGDSMAESHKGQNLAPSDFNALVENLIAAMDTENVPVPVQNRLIARLAPMRGEVLGK